MNSKEYWDNRWDDFLPRGESSYSRSWPDGQARWLELRFIVDRLKAFSPRTLSEFGCGPFTLSEDVELLDMFNNHAPLYYGYDSSPSAIRQTQRYARCNFKVFDLTTSGPLPGPRDCVLTRRTLQNLTYKEREKSAIIQKILDYPHGILIECTDTGLLALNEIRLLAGYAPLKPPDFNTYLTTVETDLILDKAEPFHFADIYYLLTRGIRHCTDFNTSYHFRAASLSRDFPTDVPLGSLQGFAW